MHSLPSFLLRAVRDCLPLSAIDGIQSKRSFVQGIHSAHENGNFQLANMIDQARAILGDRSRILPRVPPRALTLTQLDTPILRVLGGASGFHMLNGPNHASAKHVRENSGKLKQDQSIERADISTQTTDNAVSFRL